MTYAGLTISDKPALLDAKSKGYDNAYLNFNGYPERVMVDLALAQIAEMESAEKPRTVASKCRSLTMQANSAWTTETKKTTKVFNPLRAGEGAE